MTASNPGQQDPSNNSEVSGSEEKQDVGGYFSSYNDLSVHQLMLKDRPRTLAYRKFFETNREAVKDKVVLDIGAGTGILSLFAAAGKLLWIVFCGILFL